MTKLKKFLFDTASMVIYIFARAWVFGFCYNTIISTSFVFAQKIDFVQSMGISIFLAFLSTCFQYHHFFKEGITKEDFSHIYIVPYAMLAFFVIATYIFKLVVN